MIAEDGTVKTIRATFYVVGHETREGKHVVLFSTEPKGKVLIRFEAPSAESFELAPVGSEYILVSADVLKLGGIWTRDIP